jgi:hypothetical protein
MSADEEKISAVNLAFLSGKKEKGHNRETKRDIIIFAANGTFFMQMLLYNLKLMAAMRRKDKRLSMLSIIRDHH